eukprot:Nk52_evm1s1298 gene=Nk52_evmTU1s1298
MRISITNEAGDVFPIEIDGSMEVENLQALVECEAGGIPGEQQILICNGAVMSDPKRAISDYGVRDNSMVLLRRKQAPTNNPAQRFPSSNNSLPAVPQIDFGSISIPGSSGSGSRSGGNANRQTAIPHQRQMNQIPDRPDSEYIEVRTMLRSDPAQLQALRVQNPELAAAVESDDLGKFKEIFNKMHQEKRAAELKRMQELYALHANPFDPESQRKIEEYIRNQQLEENMRHAMEYNPEAFADVHLLYIECKVNNTPLKAMVDSGAQTTVMSGICAEKCGLTRLLDNRFKGEAKGVGSAKILGRVHMAQLQIGDEFLPCSLSILDMNSVDMLLGLDFLKRHLCCIDLKENCLRLGSTNTSARFLAESEIPRFGSVQQQSSSGTSNTTTTNNNNNSSSASTAGAPTAGIAPANVNEEAVTNLMSLGFTRVQVEDALKACNGNADLAANHLFSLVNE